MYAAKTPPAALPGRVQNEATGQYLNNARLTVKGTDLHSHPVDPLPKKQRVKVSEFDNLARGGRRIERRHRHDVRWHGRWGRRRSLLSTARPSEITSGSL